MLVQIICEMEVKRNMKIGNKLKNDNGAFENKVHEIFSSFIETSSQTKVKTGGKLSLSELSTFKLTDREMLKIKQGSQRSKKRYTLETKPCSPVFKQDSEYYFDCTNSKAPDGSQTNREWCYIESPEVGGKTWDFCVPIMDYDKLREENQQLMTNYGTQAKKLSEAISNTTGPAMDAIDKLKQIKESQQKLGLKINNFAKDVANIKNGVKNLYNQKNIWKKIEDKCATIADKIDKKIKEKLQEQSNNIPTPLEPTDEIVKSEEVANKQSIAPWLQSKLVENCVDCQGKLLYEEETAGDGMIGFYYNNPNFLGEFIEHKDANIDFDWTGGPPIPGINKSSFSVKWEGYLKIPITTYYTFSIETDDGAQILINNNIVLSHRFVSSSFDSKDRVDKWLSDYITAKSNPSNNLDKSNSTPMKLIGGNKYKITIMYTHSVHNDITGRGRTFIKLLWSSKEFDETVLQKKNLSSLNSFAPLKVSGFNSDLMIVRKLLENDLAFKNDVKHVMQDIPRDFRGSTCLKLTEKYTEDSLSFEINIPAYVYIARLEHYPNPIPTDFENTGEKMSLLEISQPKNKQIMDKFESRFSAPMKIYKKKYDAGKISIPLNKSSINVKGMPLIVWFGFDTSISSPLSCGGDEKLISDTTAASFQSCNSSSFFDSNWRCENGFSATNKDQEGDIWASKREGIGAWIEIQFSGLFYITRFEIMNRRNPQERNSLIEAQFSNGSKQLIKLLNIDDVQQFDVKPPVKSTSVRFTIKGVYGTINNGGAFNIYGMECKDIDNPKASAPGPDGQLDPKSMEPIFKSQEKPPIILQCKDSLSNTKKLDHFSMKNGSKIKIRCQDTCAFTRFPIYGDLKYSRDSSICKAAYHSGNLQKPNSLVWLVFENGLQKYNSVNRSGLKSKSKGKSDLTISFELVQEENNIPINTGVKIDFLDPKGSGEWLAGIVFLVEDSGEDAKLLTVKLENSDSDNGEFKIKFPDKKKITECGTHLPQRDCQGSKFNSNNTTKTLPITIRFAPKNYNKAGPYMIDSGDIFGKTGLPFGWSRDMSNRMRMRTGASQSALETLVEFPPDQKSKFCNKAIPDTNCDKVTWSIKVGHGKFNVKLSIGDSQGNSRVDLSINNKPFVDNATIEKGNLQTFEGDFNSINEMLTISSKCKNDCEYAMAKLNQIEIAPYKNPEADIPEPTPTVEDPCGNAETGGKCDIGPDILNCLYDDPLVDVAKYCNGNSLMVQVPSDYKCPTQRNKYKCVLRKFETQAECLNYCPLTCTSGLCS